MSACSSGRHMYDGHAQLHPAKSTLCPIDAAGCISASNPTAARRTVNRGERAFGWMNIGWVIEASGTR